MVWLILMQMSGLFKITLCQEVKESHSVYIPIYIVSLFLEGFYFYPQAYHI